TSERRNAKKTKNGPQRTRRQHDGLLWTAKRRKSFSHLAKLNAEALAIRLAGRYRGDVLRHRAVVRAASPAAHRALGVLSHSAADCAVAELLGTPPADAHYLDFRQHPFGSHAGPRFARSGCKPASSE